MRYLLSGMLLCFAGICLGSVLMTKRFENTAPPIGAYVDVNGARLHYFDLGPRDSELPPVILIHGASANSRDMKIALGDELAKTRRVLIFDRPGRGYSTRDSEGWGIAIQARQLHAGATAIGVSRPIVVGQSLGGAIALAYGLEFQDELSGLVLLAPVSHEWPGGVAWYNTVSETPVLGFLFRRLLLPYYGPLAAREIVPASFSPDEPPEGYLRDAGVELLFRPRDFGANAEDLVMLKRQIVEMQGNYSKLRLPMMIFAGDDDTTVSPTIHARALAEEAPHAHFEMFADTGHALHHARAQEIVAAINRL